MPKHRVSKKLRIVAIEQIVKTLRLVLSISILIKQHTLIVSILFHDPRRRCHKAKGL